MSWIDWLAVVLYFVVVFAVALRGMIGRSKTRADSSQYFLAGRHVGWFVIGASLFASNIGSEHLVGLAGAGASTGLAVSHFEIMAAFCLLTLGWVFVPFYLRSGVFTMPEFLELRYSPKARWFLSVVSLFAYVLTKVSVTVYAGAVVFETLMGIEFWTGALIVVIVTGIYTALGGLQAVVYTDTLQWMILFLGLIFLGMPMGFRAAGGLDGLRSALPPEFFRLDNVSVGQLATWAVTIIPIWFIAMTLYQRIHAARDTTTARRAWFLAGLLEYPAMAFMGASLGMFARVLFPGIDPEMGLPMLIRDVLPIGVTGLVLAAYFAAIMSTADSCLLASVGNTVDDIYGRHVAPASSETHRLGLSRVLTLVIGFGSVGFALYVPTVIDSILLAYSFMVAGLLFPTLGALFWRRVSGTAAFWSILAGGTTTVALNIVDAGLPGDPVFYGLALSGLTLLVLTLAVPAREAVTS